MGAQDLYNHLATGATTVCRAWALARQDGVTLGFTDHDRELQFDGIRFSADAGLTARALQQTTGLAVDNTEAMGALSSSAISEADILAGRYDGAEVRAWLVNWQDVSARALQFRGSVGEIRRAGGAFHADLRGLAERLNTVQGRVVHRHCAAILGDKACGFDLSQPGFFAEVAAGKVDGRVIFRFADLRGFEDRWFERGRMVVKSGAASGLSGVIKSDRLEGGFRIVELWQAIGAEIAPGDILRIEAGCDKSTGSCGRKFNNFLNFRGFPHVPGEDWLSSYPTSSRVNDGGKLSR